MAQASKATEQVGKGADQAAKQADTAMGRMVQSAQNNRQAWDQVGATLTGFGAASVGALGLAVKSAMDWESAWAGVQKTVDGTAPQMEALEQGLRSMARELPASHAEIAAVAEAAGQLGIATPNILSFTRTMINMGEATNLSADEAATSLARFVNITGTSQNKIGLLGASIVGLGNNFATTESEIVAMSMRLAGAGAQANMSEGDILGIATAMSSVGIEAEAGGSAMSQTMKRIGKAVDEGGDSLELFAQVSGMSAQEFSRSWREDPTTALDAFITGLSGVESQGMTTNGVLAELGITGIREADSLLRLSAASEQGADGMSLLADAVQTGNAEFDKGTALIEEASKRYETAESRIAMAKNALVDAGISIGGVVLPAFASLADGVANIAGGFADLPGPVHAVVTGLGGIAGAAGLGAGAFLLLFPRVMDTVSAFREIGLLSDSMAGKMGRATVAVGKAGLAFAALSAVPPILNAVTDAMKGIDDAELDLGMNELTAGLIEGERSGRMFDSVLGDMYDSGALNKQMFSDLGSTVREVADINWFQNLVGGLAATGINDAKDRLLELSDAFVLLSQTDLTRAQETFAAFMAEAEQSGATFDDVMKVMPSFRDELAGIATQMGLDGTDSAVLYKIAMGEISPVVDEATGAVGAFAEGMDEAAEATQSAADAATEALSAMSELAGEFIDAERGALNYADAMDEAAEAAKENGKHWEDGTEAADENKRALLDLAEQAWATADALSAEGKSGTFLEQAREDLIETAVEMGMGKEAAEEYVDQLLATPEEIATQVDLDTQAAQEQWTALWDELGYHPPEVPVGADTDPAKEEVAQFSGLVGDMPPGEVGVGADTSQAQEEVTIWGSQVGDVPTSDVPVHADIEPAAADVFRLETTIDNAGGTVTINGNSTPGDQVLSTLMAEINAGDGTVTIDGQSYPADQALAAAIEAINRGEGTVTIEGNNKPANSATDSAKRHADGTTGTIDVDANTGGAESDINSTARDRSSNVNQTASTGAAESALNRTARNRTSRITVFQSVRTSGSATARAMGGPVYGPGTGTSDSIPALLSNGEHVITAKEVAQAGGQDAIYRMREAIRSGFKFANGGAVERGTHVAAYSQMAPVARASNVSASVDTGAIASAVNAAMSSWQPMVDIGGRRFTGLMVEHQQRAKAMGGR